MLLPESGSALFAGSVEAFVEMAATDALAAHLAQQYGKRWGTPTKSEIRSWRNSLEALAEVVQGTGLADVGVALELKLPLNDRRVDAAFVARNRRGEPQVVLVELKQWESAAPSLYPNNVLMGGKELLHPCAQCAAYAEYLRDGHSAFTEEGFGARPCAYLHNMTGDVAAAIRGVAYEGAIADAPLFTADDVPRLRAFLDESLRGGGGMELLPALIEGGFSASEELLAKIRKSYDGSPAWTLLDEQRLAYNVVRGTAERAAKTGEKTVVVVLGGPGTGKSAIAAHLVPALAGVGEDKRKVMHATGSKAFRTNILAITPRSAEQVFRYFNQFREKKVLPDALDVLVLDEAHRIRKTSNDRRTRRAEKSEISQARELVRAARVSVFFLDERQNVRPDEIGSVAEIVAAAEAEGARVLPPITLAGQFRCNGCTGYIDWVNDLMSPAPRPAGAWRSAGEYDLRLFDSPGAMEAAILEKAEARATARLVAGFCWPWSDPDPDGTLVDDVEIDGWRRPWNEKSPEQQKANGKKQRSAPRAHLHPYFKWVSDPRRVREVGCVFSAQGLEFEYVGVILGNDLVWRDGIGWVGARDASHDSEIRRRRLTYPQLLDLLQRTYRVLLTRGSKGTFIYSTDYDTRAFLHTLIPESAGASEDASSRSRP